MKTVFGTPSAPQRTLIVEDDPDSRTTLRMLFKLHGYTCVETVADAASALARLRTHEPPVDVVLCDLRLQGPLSGYDLAREIRGDPKLRRIVLVAHTGFGDDKSYQLAQAVGFDAFLVKPTESEVIVRTCRDLVEAQQEPEAP